MQPNPALPLIQIMGDQEKENQCICEGNWRLLVKETEHLLGKRFVDRHGTEFTFFGLVHGSDDYYYGMSRKGVMRLVSCVGDLEGVGFRPSR